MPWRENKGVANLDGIYTDFIELLRKMFWSSEDRVRDADHRNLNGIYTDGFYSLKARNLWRKSLIKIWPMARNNLSLR